MMMRIIIIIAILMILVMIIHPTGVAKYTVDDVPVELCTHAIYAFAVLDAEALTIAEHDAHLDTSSGLDNYRRFIGLRGRRPEVKVS